LKACLTFITYYTIHTTQDIQLVKTKINGSTHLHNTCKRRVWYLAVEVKKRISNGKMVIDWRRVNSEINVEKQCKYEINLIVKKICSNVLTSSLSAVWKRIRIWCFLDLLKCGHVEGKLQELSLDSFENLSFTVGRWIQNNRIWIIDEWFIERHHSTILLVARTECFMYESNYSNCV